jgi:hypothetical protein
MSMVGFPLLLIPLAIYNIIVFLMPGVSFGDPLVTLRLVSGADWPITLSDMLLAVGIILLLLEVIKGARPGAKFVTDHLLSLTVFGAAAAEFVLWPKFGTSIYFQLTLLALVDFCSGLALRVRRAPVAASAAPISRKAVKTAEAPRQVEPEFEPVSPPPVSPPPVPSAAPIGESELHHPEPSTASQPVAGGEPSPRVPSPELQPGNGFPPSPETPRSGSS